MNWDEEFLTAKKMISKGLFHAANSILENLEMRASEQSDKNKLGELYYEKGKIAQFNHANYKNAVMNFTRAIESTSGTDTKVNYAIYLGFAYRKMSEFDTCYRYLTNLVDELDGVANSTKGRLFANLSAIQGINGFYDQAIRSIDRSYEAYEGLSNPLEEILNNNKGLAYLELGIYDKAEYLLKRAMDLGGSEFIEPLSELGRLCLLQGRLEESVEYAKRALNMIWSSIIEYNKEELALLCNLLANIGMHLNERELAMRLAEKAQVFFGQLGMWRQWQNIESQLERWHESVSESIFREAGRVVSLEDIHHFLQSLEALNSQELIHRSVSQLLDVRVYYVQLFAQELHLSKQDQEDLVLASRFADYGLTALESEVIMNPTRSKVAFEQYKQHPLLSVRMLKTLNLSERVADIVLDHHEHYDGSGYPNGKRGEEIHYLARILRLIDTYASGIVMERKMHSELIDNLVAEAGFGFDPRIVNAFVKMHDVAEFDTQAR